MERFIIIVLVATIWHRISALFWRRRREEEEGREVRGKGGREGWEKRELERVRGRRRGKEGKQRG